MTNVLLGMLAVFLFGVLCIAMVLKVRHGSRKP